ncbi:MAG TPA: DUF4097 family beta strand repeat-containing protein [Limnochordia bacterium]|nr:DUF4097 family beta strand repeat-containing protein [Limnochordia bacterium]
MDLFVKKRIQEEFVLHEEINSIELIGFSGSISWLPVEGAGPCIVAEKEVRGLSSGAVDEVLEELKVESTISQGKMVLRAEKPIRPFGLVTSQVSFRVYASPDQIEEFFAQTSNGTISLDVDFHGKLDLRTANGRIELQSGKGQVNATTSNGRVTFGKLALQGLSSVRTSNGRIEGQAEFAADGNYLFETSNGAIELRMPHDTPGSFRVTTSNGKVTFGVGEDKVAGGKQVTIDRGEGPSVRIATSNGSVSVLGY